MITRYKSEQLKAIAILMMLCLHLFNNNWYLEGLYQPLIFIGKQPLIYYISLFCDACVPILAFVSGYGLYFKYTKEPETYKIGNIKRIKKIYLNYWIILFLFAVLLGWIINKDSYPGSWLKFLLNFTALDTSYNGAWWFFTIYVLFVLTSSFWFRLLNKVNPYFFVMALLLLYILGFYFRIYKTNLFENETLQWFHRQSALYFCTLFQFMLGAFALKYQWNTHVGNIIDKLKYKNLVGMIGIVSLIVFHGIVPNFVVAPFTALCFIFLFSQMNIGKVGNKVLDFLAPHTTNLWLIHMFFYLIYLKDFTYSATYVIPIFILLVIMCLLSSYVVNFINQKAQQWL